MADLDVETTLSKLTLEEKIEMTSGRSLPLLPPNVHILREFQVEIFGTQLRFRALVFRVFDSRTGPTDSEVSGSSIQLQRLVFHVGLRSVQLGIQLWWKNSASCLGMKPKHEVYM
jgi:hypothetical protein